MTGRSGFKALEHGGGEADGVAVEPVQPLDAPEGEECVGEQPDDHARLGGRRRGALLGDADDEDQGRFKYVHGDDSFVWETGGSTTDCMTLDGSCNLTVAGTTALNNTVTMSKASNPKRH